jgi:hypothetical protein
MDDVLPVSGFVCWWVREVAKAAGDLPSGLVLATTCGNPWLTQLEGTQRTRNPFGNLNRSGADFPHEIAIHLTPHGV